MSHLKKPVLARLVLLHIPAPVVPELPWPVSHMCTHTRTYTHVCIPRGYSFFPRGYHAAPVKAVGALGLYLHSHEHMGAVPPSTRGRSFGAWSDLCEQGAGRGHGPNSYRTLATLFVKPAESSYAYSTKNNFNFSYGTKQNIKIMESFMLYLSSCIRSVTFCRKKHPAEG